MPSIGVVNQKGGVGKTTTSRGLAVAYADAGWSVCIADMDLRQTTATNWTAMRLRDGIKPEVVAQPCRSVKSFRGAGHNLVIFDAPAYSSETTIEIAKAVDFVIIPTGATQDDLEPAMKLGHELLAAGIKSDAFCFALICTLSHGASAGAREYLQSDPRFRVAAGELPAKPGYELAQNKGLSVLETQYPTLNAQAQTLFGDLIDRITEKTHG